MRDKEVEYWNKVASKITRNGAIGDNWAKRELLMRFLSKVPWKEQRVLEIGVGCGVSAGALSICCGRKWDYIGTEMSPMFAEVARNSFMLNVVEADILSLPEGMFTRILALDSLEHVRREDRPRGYKAIVDRLEKDGLLLINMPCHRSSHESEFDHGFDLYDIAAFEDLGLSLQRYELYEYRLPDEQRLSAFVMLSK